MGNSLKDLSGMTNKEYVDKDMGNNLNDLSGMIKE